MAGVISGILDELQGRAAGATLWDLRVGAHWTFVGVTVEGQRYGGLASTLSGGEHGGPPVRRAGHLMGVPVADLLALAESESSLEASIGLATLNALLDVDVSACVAVNAADIIETRGAGRKVAIVGHFPFIPQVRKVAETLWVLELKPRPGDLPASEASKVLPEADVVALTGSSLINQTFDDLIGLCNTDALVVVLGATTPLSPRLFTVGVDAVSGTRVVDPDAALLAVSQGATFRQIPGKQLLTMFRDPALGKAFNA